VSAGGHDKRQTPYSLSAKRARMHACSRDYFSTRLLGDKAKVMGAGRCEHYTSAASLLLLSVLYVYQLIEPVRSTCMHSIVFRLYLPCEKLDGGGGGQSWKDLPCITVPAPPILNN